MMLRRWMSVRTHDGAWRRGNLSWPPGGEAEGESPASPLHFSVHTRSDDAGPRRPLVSTATAKRGTTSVGGTVPACSSRVRPAARRCAGWYPRLRPCQPRCIMNRRQRGWQRCEPSSAATLPLLVHPLPLLPQLARPRPLLPPPPVRPRLPRGHRNGPFTEGS